MTLPRQSRMLVEATYCDTQVPVYKRNPFIRALGNPLTDDEARKALRRKPDFDESLRLLSPIERIHCLPDIMELVVPLSANIDFQRMFGVMVRQGYRNRFGLDYWQRIRNVDKVAGKMMEFATNGKIAGTTIGGIVHGLSGLGKTAMLSTTLGTYPDGVIVHKEFEGVPLNAVQVPFLIVECNHDASVSAFVERLLGKLGDMVNEDFVRLVYKKSAAKTIPILVEKLLEYSVGMVVVDEAEFITARYSGGDAALIYFWINLMNSAGIPLLLISNPEILKVMGRYLKAGMRFSSGGEMALHELPRKGEWEVLMKAMWPYQYTKKKTDLDASLMDQFYHHSAGILRATLLLYKFTQQVAIEEEGDEVITPWLVQKTAEKYAPTLQKLIAAVRINTPESRLEGDDLGKVLRRKSQKTAITVAPKAKQTPSLDEGDRLAPDSLPAPKAKPMLRRGQKPAVGLLSYLDPKVRGDLSVYGALLNDGVIKLSTEFLN